MAGAGAGDLNPAFQFDLGGFGGDEAQAPWEFAGALAQADKELPGKATTIDYKIAQQLARNKRQKVGATAAAARGGAAAKRTGRQQQQRAAAASSSDDDDDDSDAPLPGEVDDDDDDDSDAEGVDLAAAAAAAGSDDEEEEESAGGDGSEEKEASDDEIARAGMELDSDELATSSDDDDDGDGDEAQRQQAGAAAAAAAGKLKQPPQPAEPLSKRQQQQQQKLQKQQQQQEAQQQQEQQRKQQLAQQQRQQQQAGGMDDDSDDDDDDDDDDDSEQPQQQQQGGKRQKGAGGVKTKGGGGYFDATPKDTKFSAQSFADLHLSRPLVRACQALGYAHPTPIQAACIPLALAGRDICGSAVTGSGKTAAFGLPLLERLLHRNKRMAATYVLVLTPVRELAVQVHSMIQKLGQFTDIQAALVVGGLSLQAQAATLRSYPEIVVATPGRMIDHLRNTQSVGLEDLAVLVLDEADRLLEMGFAEEIREVVKMAPVRRQTMLFSATMTEEVQKLVTLSLRHPVRLAADAAAHAPKELTQEIVRLKGSAAAQKEAALLALCGKAFRAGRTIIFAKTKQRAHRLKILFGLAGLPAAGELHGDMTQAARLESLDRFRKGEVAFLLATDVAARGLDILGVETVINFDCPTQLSSYLHRVGRTARAGAKGRSLTFIEDDDRTLLKEVIRKGGVQMQQRQVLQSSVDTWQHSLERLEPQVLSIIYEEREERALRKAEMEATKALNMLDHEEEIYARPPRTWFQTEKEKKEVALRAKAAADGKGGGEEGGGDEEGMSGQQKRNKAKNDRRLEMKQQRAKEAKEAAKRKPNKLMAETSVASRTIKAVKAREQQLRLEGMTGGKAGKVAASLVTGIKRKKKSSKKGKEGALGGDGDLFSGDGLGKPGSAGRGGASGGGGSGTKVYAGGASSGKVKGPRGATGLGKSELNRVKRGGKGTKSFKSKAKHRRR